MSNLENSFFDDCLALARGWTAAACQLCAAKADPSGLCPACHSSLGRLPATHCPLCAAPGPLAETCGRCLKHPPAYDRICAALVYEYPVDLLVQGLKYRGQLACARPLAQILADRLESEPYPDLVIPMPLSAQRLAERGFNQAQEIARIVAADFGLRLDANLCRRLRHSAAQASLPWKMRAANVRNAYLCDRDLRGMDIAVVDDVLTTGATMHEVAKTLKRQGARLVTGWIVARTPRPE